MARASKAGKRDKGTSARRRLSRARRHARVLRKVRGTTGRPRLVVHRTLKHMDAQLIDDDRGVCITGISTRSGDVRSRLEGGETKSEESRVAGLVMAERVRDEGFEAIVFDRGGYRYHGRVKAFAEGAREGGLEF